MTVCPTAAVATSRNGAGCSESDRAHRSDRPRRRHDTYHATFRRNKRTVSGGPAGGNVVGVFRWDEHTGELALAIEAPTADAVYEDAVRAMAQLLDEDDDTPPTATRELALDAPDRPRLLAELLAELAFLAETEGFVPVALERLAAGERRLEATVRGRIGAPPHLVKAVTYHRLAFDGADGGWRASVVLDV